MNNYIEKCITSKTLKNYWKNTACKITDSQTATLIYNSPLHLADKIKLLSSLQKKTANRILAKSITQRILYIAKLFEYFPETDEYTMYLLEIQNHDTYTYSPCGYFTNAFSAIEYGKTYRKPYNVQKHTLCDSHIVKTEDLIVPMAEMCFNEHGLLEEIWSTTIKEPFDEYIEDPQLQKSCLRFENQSIDLAYPFRRGDIVYSSRYAKYGIVISPDNTSDWDNYSTEITNMIDYSDWNVTVEFLYTDNETSSPCFHHLHVAPPYLEMISPTENVPFRELLMHASELIKGSGSIECFQMLCRQQII